MTVNQRIVLAQRPVGEPTAETFRIEEAPVPAPAEGEVLVRTIYLSLDPYMRGRLSDAKSYAAPVEIGEVIVGGTVGQVVESADPAFEPGALVLAYGGWQEYSVHVGGQLRRIEPPAGVPISAYLGVLGMPGFTAYSGLLVIGDPKPGETVAVAAATGPVGSAVGQIARLKGAKTIGIAGGPAKVAYLKELGFDHAIDHRGEDLPRAVKDAASDGIDVYFENVGGKVFDAVWPRMNTYGRIPICGRIANYNATELPPGPDRTPEIMSGILVRSLTIRGFIQDEFVSRYYKDFLRDMSGWVASGEVKFREDVTRGLENAPEAFAGMLQGRNFGKTLVQVGEDPS